MFPRVEHVRHLGEYRLELRFTDGTKGELDLKERVVGRGGVFASLEDIAFFQRVKVDPEAGTIVWPNDVDLCPDVLYSQVTGLPLRVPEPAARTVPSSAAQNQREGQARECGRLE